ncbi:MAG: AAA family ATPase [Promethearchaeota archaeon]
MERHNDYFRQKVWYIISTIQANQLFVHSNTIQIKFSKAITILDFLPKDSSKKKPKTSKTRKSSSKSRKSKKIKTMELPEILTLCILNALVPNSAMLLIGGHGGGKTSIVKYLGRMFTGLSLDEIEEGILRGHPQLTEEKIIATLNLPKLMKNGEEEVIWRTFASNFWKIIDEVNRCSPYTQNILLSLLAEGKIKYYDAVLNVTKFCLYATMNQNDVGTFEMSMPFLDRFGISVPISMPTSQDLSQILRSRDEKLGGYDELVQVPKVLTEEDLLNIWFEVGEVSCNIEAEDYIHAIVREFTLCTRIDKGNSDYLKPSTGLCTGCHYNIPNKIPCSHCDSILSVRVAKDLLRYARALTWLLGLEEVSINTIDTIAPYIIAHRVHYVDRTLNDAPFWGNKYQFTVNLLKMIRKRYANRRKAYDLIETMRAGKAPTDAISKLTTFSKSDLIVKHDLLPFAKKLNLDAYQTKIKEIELAYQQKDVGLLSQFRRELLLNMEFPNRGQLISNLNDKLRILTLYNFNCSLEIWNSIRFTIDSLIPSFTKKLKESTQQRGTYRLRTEDLDMEINVTGTNQYDIVNFSFYGGEIASTLKNEIELNHGKMLKNMEDLVEEARLAQIREDDEMGLVDIDSSSTSPEEKSNDVKKPSILGEDFYNH